jgi:replicative DNA helicase
LQAFGETRVVACVGAQLSGEQVKTLIRYRVASVTICLDPDGAGDRGTLACIRRLHDAGIRALVAPRLPDGVDPDEFLLRYGVEAWREHIRHADHAFRFQARSIIGRHRGESWTDRGLAGCLDEAITFAAGIIDPERSPDLEQFFWDEILRATGADREAVSVRQEALRAKIASEAQRREYKNLVSGFQKLEGSDFLQAKELLHREVDRLRTTERGSRVEPVRNVAEELDEHEAYLQQWRGQEFIGLPQRTLPALDKKTRGLRGLILVAAAPNVGKTTLALQLGVDAVVHNPDAALLFLSLEMSSREMLTRIKSRFSGLNWETLVFGSARVDRRRHGDAYFTSQELQSLAEADATLRDIGQRIRILDHENFPEPTLEKVLGQIADLKARTGATRVFVLVDYLQVWPVSDTSGKIRTDIDADKWRMGQMKALRDANGSDPVLVISEARKPSEKESTWGGGMADVMGSARSTYTPDMVLLLRPLADAELGSAPPDSGRPPKDIKQQAAEERAKHATMGFALQRLSIVKGRDGTTHGDIDLQFSMTRSGDCIDGARAT